VPAEGIIEMEIENNIEIYRGVIENDAFEVCKEVKRIVERLQAASDIDKEQCFDVKVILSELLQNAIKHGNECDKDKKICLEVRLGDSGNILEITIRDQGCGFDPISTMNLAYSKISELDPDNMDESGRGLFIVQNLCDCMEFNSTGNAIKVIKRLYCTT